MSVNGIVLHVSPPAYSSLDESQLNELASVVRDKDRSLLSRLGEVEGIIRTLDTDKETGILLGNDDDIKARREKFQSVPHGYPKRGLKRGFRLCAGEAIKDPLVVILVVFVLFTSCIEIKDHGMKSLWPVRGTQLLEIVTVVILSALINFWPVTLSRDRRFSGYSPGVDVVREGSRKKIPIWEVVVGDIVFLKPGDQVPADGLFIDGRSLKLENITAGMNIGKPDRAEISQNNPFIFSGTMVASGHSSMVVTAVGRGSRVKKVIWMQGNHGEELKMLGTKIRRLGKYFGVSTFMWFLLRFYAEENDEDVSNGAQKASEFVEFLSALVGVLATSAIIALTSNLDGLDLAVKLALTYSMSSLSKARVLIKKPALCHQVASVDTICFNKTGTFTSDKSEVKKFRIGLNAIENVPHNRIDPYVLELLHQAIGLNTTQPRFGSTLAASQSSTEKVVFEWATLQLAMDEGRLKRSCNVIGYEPFDPISRRSGVWITKNVDATIHVHRKGAPDVILGMCSHYYESTGILQIMDNVIRSSLKTIVEQMEVEGLRCIAFAHKNSSLIEYNNPSGLDLTLLGVVGFENQISSEAIKFVKDCSKAGINFKLLTGDSTETAKYMAEKGGLLIGHGVGQVIEGHEFRKFTPKERLEKVDQISVLAKATPEDKFLLVEALKKKERVVAYVGGGLGDARGLKEANVGICFGADGRGEILKAYADIIIMEKKFSEVFNILKWGRGFHANIETYVQLLLTATYVDLVVDFVMTIFPCGFTNLFYTGTAISKGELPTPVFQLLWVKLMFSSVAPLTVLIKHHSNDLMSEPARNPNEPLMTGDMERSTHARAFYQIIVLLAIHFVGKSVLHLSLEERNTTIFNTFMLCQVFTLINAKMHDRMNISHDIHDKKWFWGIIGVITVFQVIMVEFLKSVTSTAKLNAKQWVLCILIASASIPVSSFLRYICPIDIQYLSTATKPKLE